MNIGLLIIGSEILEGKISDANTRQLSSFLRNHHLELKTVLTVSDSTEQIHFGLKTLYSLCDVVVTSGGLGPTLDDVTKEAMASYLGRKVSFSEQAYEIAAHNYQRFNRPFSGKEHGYCFLPEGFVALDNTTGMAPGLFTEHLGKYLLCGPGVPKEFKSLLEDHFQKLVAANFPASSELIDSITVKTKRIPEEKIFGEVDTTLWDKLSALGSVSSLPHVMGVDIGVKIKANSAAELADKKNQVLKIFEESPVKSGIWQIGNLSLEEYIVQIANKKNIQYGFAESATGGLCAHRITSVPGSSKTFVGSIVSYAESVKQRVLNVEAATLKKYSDVSVQTASEMCSGAAQQLQAKIVVAITGIAGPAGGTPEKPVGTVCFGVTTNGKTITHTTLIPGDREQLKLRFSQLALYYLLEELEKSS
jgi:nicotinamide-nucleotide amidase